MFGKLFKPRCAELPEWQAELQITTQMVPWPSLFVGFCGLRFEIW